PALIACLAAQLESDRQGQAHVEDGHRQRKLERNNDGAPQMLVGEEFAIVGKPVALDRREREDKAVAERINEEEQQEYDRGRDQQQRRVWPQAGSKRAHAPPSAG